MSFSDSLGIGFSGAGFITVISIPKPCAGSATSYGAGVLNDIDRRYHVFDKHLLEAEMGDDLPPLAVTCDLPTQR